MGTLIGIAMCRCCSEQLSAQQVTRKLPTEQETVKYRRPQSAVFKSRLEVDAACLTVKMESMKRSMRAHSKYARSASTGQLVLSTKQNTWMESG